MEWGVRAAAVVATVAAWAGPAPACPLCGTDTGRQVRAGIFGDDFGRNLLLTVLPFAVLLGIVALIHFGLPWGRTAPRPADSAPPGDGG
jgi:hypothetical protein